MFARKLWPLKFGWKKAKSRHCGSSSEDARIDTVVTVTYTGLSLW